MLKINNFILKTDDRELFTTKEITLKSGTKTLLVGNNDSGKTLFLKSLQKKYFNHNGNFEIKNEGIFKKKRRETLLIDNQVNLIAEQTVYKNIIMPLNKVDDSKKELIYNLCGLAKLSDINRTKCSYLSYSQAKKIEFIRALVVNPLLILIDDIDNYFDDIGLNLILRIFDEAKQKSVLFATAKKTIENFDEIYKIQNNLVVKL